MALVLGFGVFGGIQMDGLHAGMLEDYRTGGLLDWRTGG